MSIKPRHIQPLHEWIPNEMWMEDKTGTGPKLDVRILGRIKQRAHNKSVEAVLRSDEDIIHELRIPSREVMHVMQKREGSKMRAVLKTGSKLNRKMVYLSHILEEDLHGSPLSTLFALVAHTT